MPYIKNGRREHFRKLVNEMEAVAEESMMDSGNSDLAAGDLNYMITMLCQAYLYAHGIEVRYSKINDIVGVLECAKMEFYRRLAGPYENNKIIENGDVIDDKYKKQIVNEAVTLMKTIGAGAKL